MFRQSDGIKMRAIIFYNTLKKHIIIISPKLKAWAGLHSIRFLQNHKIENAQMYINSKYENILL